MLQEFLLRSNFIYVDTMLSILQPASLLYPLIMVFWVIASAVFAVFAEFGSCVAEGCGRLTLFSLSFTCSSLLIVIDSWGSIFFVTAGGIQQFV